MTMNRREFKYVPLTLVVRSPLVNRLCAPLSITGPQVALLAPPLSSADALVACALVARRTAFSHS